RVAQSPVMGRSKVYIIDEVHMLSSDAFNALLKTLEEPPDDVVFILATTEMQKLPMTVVSRCQRYGFSRLDVEEIAARLQSVAQTEHMAIEPGAIDVVADAADGALRDALSLLDQVFAMVSAAETITEEMARQALGSLDFHMIEQLVEALMDDSWIALIPILQNIAEQGRDYRQILRDVARTLRDVAVWRHVGSEQFPSYRQPFLDALNARVPAVVSPSAWFRALDVLAEAETRLRGAFPAQLIVETALFKVQQVLQGQDVNREAPALEPKLPPVPPPTVRQERPEQTPSAPVKSDAEKPPANPLAQAGSDLEKKKMRVLELIKRERVTSAGLLQDTEFFLPQDDQLVVRFQFSAQYGIFIKSDFHKAVLDKAVHEVFGPSVHIVLTQANGEETVKASASQEGEELSAQAVRTWFGENAPLRGFDK
ncbi:MAG: AAA family ATPase, partial [Firmicutes bacterium]|nr:AAA family ATPase [Bacillota bacterium]